MSQIDERALATHIKENLPTPTGWKSCANAECRKAWAANGLPLATTESKNPGTRRSWRNAVRECEQDRDPRTPSFEFKQRALVHLAGGPDAVHTATRISESDAPPPVGSPPEGPPSELPGGGGSRWKG